jgi:hypothetical protein
VFKFLLQDHQQLLNQLELLDLLEQGGLLAAVEEELIIQEELVDLVEVLAVHMLVVRMVLEQVVRSAHHLHLLQLVAVVVVLVELTAFLLVVEEMVVPES